jgi:hypothetical protein
VNKLTSFVGHVGKREQLALVPYRLLHARMRNVIITTPFTERFTATPSSTVGTDRSSAVSALGYSTVAAWRPYVTIAVSVFDLAKLAHVLCRLGCEFGEQFPNATTRLFVLLFFCRSVIARC